VHIIQLKALTCVRVGSKQKKIDIDVPSISDFIHKIYIHVARKIYTNIYLFEKNIAPLQIQKNNREIEIIIKECILNSIRDSVPVENILRAYMDETEEQDVEVKDVEEPLPDIAPEPPATATPATATPATATPASAATPATAIKEIINEYKETTDFGNSRISFADDDTFVDVKGNTSIVTTPKDEKNLEELEKMRALTQETTDDEDDDEDEKLTIGESIKLDIIDINDLNKSSVDLKPPVLDFEILT
jgi:hypothetical protein